MLTSRRSPFSVFLTAVFWFWGACAVPPGDAWGQAEQTVVINELHTDPDVKTDLLEFVELHNPGPADVDLSGWCFSDGIEYAFPAGAVLRAGAYVVVCQYPERVEARWGTGRIGIPDELIYGPYVGRLNNEGERVALCNPDGQVVDEVSYKLGFPWPTVGDPMSQSAPGSGCSLQLVNPAFDNDLAGSWRSHLPTPAAANAIVFAENIPPHIRQVRHTPQQPASGQVVTIAARVTDPDGVASVTLRYQIVSPGQYVSRNDGAYAANWVDIAMHDDGLDGDVRAFDDVYTVQIPAAVQMHRRLVRYRIVVADTLGLDMIVPYADDPQPNFAYFVYDGVPAWRGAVQPGVTPVVEFPAEVMRSVPVYHLISKKADVEECTWFSHYGGSDYRWWGTLVYDGVVYDHIRFRARGGVWRYAMGKNMWKHDFNRGHYFQARDDFGEQYDTTWDKLNFSACIQQGSFGQRGEQGMFEALSNRLFNLLGAPASKTNYVHFRIIDEAHEDGLLNAAHSPLTSGGTQYDGDFWGLYMTLEQMDGRFLKEHDLPDGNLYKMDNNIRETNNQGPTQPSDQSDLSWFLSAYGGGSEQWWRQNVNLQSYYGYYVAYQAVHHGDITGKNWFLYHHPETDRWWQLPWDVDLTWTTYYGSNDPSDPFSRANVFRHTAIDIEKKNRVREALDLLFNPDQMNQLIDEYAAVINDPGGGLSIVDADRAMWDYHWVVGDGAYPRYLDRDASFKAGEGRFYAEAQRRGYDRSFEGMVQVMKDYVIERIGHMERKAGDSDIPATPTITYTGPAGYPTNALTFQTSAFADPQGPHTFGSVQWRVAEVAAGSQVVESPDVSGFVLLPDGATWRYFKGRSEPPGAWRKAFFDDSGWLQGQTTIGYGESFISTNLADMRSEYTTVYLRKSFSVADLDAFDRLILEVKYDDGVIVWINGQLVYLDNVAGAELPHTATADGAIENTDFVRRDLGDADALLVEGMNVIAVQVLNASLGGSSDCFIDARLVGEKPAGADDGAPPATPQLYRRRPGRYEIDAVWTGPESIEFSSEATIPATGLRPGRTYRARCRMKDNTGRTSHWSTPVQFVAGEPIAAGILADLRVTELMYDPPEPVAGGDTDNDEFEFIELKNTGDETLDLSTVSLADGVVFDFAGGDVTMLAPGAFVLVVRNRTAFESRYGSDVAARVAGQYQGRFANGGENVLLLDHWNGTLAEFEYGDGRGWPLAADGGGHSLVPRPQAIPGQPDGTLDYPGNWRASTYIGGSPGQDDPAPTPSVLINEFLAYPVEAGGALGQEWIELYNPTQTAIDLDDWYLSDDIDRPDRWALPGISLPAGGHVAFDDADFGLNRTGEQIVLSHLPGSADDRIVDAIRFEAQEQGISLGRYPDGGDYWLRMVPSRDAPNADPVPDVVIDEVMYHPVDVDDEYIELFNPTSEPVELDGPGGPWRLDGAVEYRFAPGRLLPAGGRLVVVGFDPLVETSRWDAFAAAYGAEQLTAGVDVVGPWTGSLSNRGERISLERPDAGRADGDPVVWPVVDEVIYGDVAPWPPQADGQGDALQRISADAAASGHDPANWQAAPPTPGRAP